MKKSWLNWVSKTRVWMGVACVFFSGKSALAEINQITTDNFILQGRVEEAQLSQWGDLAEERRRDIAYDLGFYTITNWEEKCHLFLAPSASEFALHSNAPKWARGWSRMETRKLNKNSWKVQRTIWVCTDIPDSEMEPLLSHEIAHLLFREFLEFPDHLPLWLDEGVALWAETENRGIYQRTIRTAVRKKKAYPLSSFFSFREYPKDKRLFYSQAYSIIEFLISEYGIETFQRFSRFIRDGDSFQEAMYQAYQISSQDLKDWETEWKNWVLAQE